jgi:hypothetical protein
MAVAADIQVKSVVISTLFLETDKMAVPCGRGPDRGRWQRGPHLSRTFFGTGLHRGRNHATNLSGDFKPLHKIGNGIPTHMPTAGAQP